MSEYNHPDIYIEEVESNDRPIDGAGTSITGFCGIARRGPVGKPIKIAGIRDFKRWFGEAISGEALFYSVRGFFENGGTEAHILRLGHYTDPTDKSTLAAQTSSKITKGIGGKTPAQFIGDVAVSTVDLREALDAGQSSLTIEVNDGGDDAVDLDLTKVSQTGAAGAFTGATFLGGETVSIQIDSGAVQVVTFAAGDDTLVNALIALNTQLDGAKAVDSGGQIKIESDTRGTRSAVAITAVSDVSVTNELGLSVNASPANAQWALTASAVTFAELKARIEGIVMTAVAGDLMSVGVDGNNFMVLTVTDFPGGDASDTEIDLKVGGALLLAALGIDGLGSQGGEAVAAGISQAQIDSFTFFAGFRGEKSPGMDGDKLKIEIVDVPKRPSLGAGNDLILDVIVADTVLRVSSLAGFRAQGVIKLVEGPTTEFAIIQKADSRMDAGALVHELTLSGGLANAFTAALCTVESVEHTLNVYYDDLLVEVKPQMSVNPLSDNYIGSVINNPKVGSERLFVEDLGVAFPNNVLVALAKTSLSGGTSETAGFVDADVQGDKDAATGLFALDSVQSLNLLAVGPSFGGVSTVSASPAVHGAMLAYAGGRMDCFAVLDAPELAAPAAAPLIPSAALTYRRDTLGSDSRWGAMYYPFLFVQDPAGIGRNPETSVPPSGHVCGVYARTDAAPPPDGGVSAAPAGEGYGKLRGVKRLAYETGDSEQGTLNINGVNVIRRFSRGGPAAPGIVVWGARTLSISTDWRYIQVRRTMTFIEQSIKQGTRWAIFGKNGPNLWDRLNERITDFLRGMWENDQLAGTNVNEAFFVKIDGETTTQDDIDEGRLIGLIGVALHRPAEFIIFRFSQSAAGGLVVEQA